MNTGSTQHSWRPSVFALSMVTAVAVSTIYLPQALLAQFVAEAGASPATASVIATAVQLGYAIGIFLLVPLADHLQPRRQITAQIVLLTLALVATAALPGPASIAIGFFAVGLVANIAQLIIPTATKLAPEPLRHMTTSVLVGSLLIGIFGGRILAGVLGPIIGWRGVVLVFAALVALSLPLARVVIPARMTVARRVSYPRLLLRTLGRLGTNRTLRSSSAQQFLCFGAFTAVWTVMVLQLTGPSLGWSLSAAGVFGVVGIAAGVATLLSTPLIRRWGATRMLFTSLSILMLSLIALLVVDDIIVLFSVSVFALTWANQMVQSVNQGRVLGADPAGAAQSNTIFMVAVFLGGSVGALLGPVAFQSGGMPEVAAWGIILVGLAGVIAVVSTLRRRAAMMTAW